MDEITNPDEVKVEALQRDVDLDQGAQELAKNAKLSHPSPDPPSEAMQKPINSPTFLTALVKWHPAIGAFQFLADCTNSSEEPPDVRFNKAREEWKKLFWLCVTVDLILMCAVLFMLGVIAVRVIYLTIFA